MISLRFNLDISSEASLQKLSFHLFLLTVSFFLDSFLTDWQITRRNVPAGLSSNDYRQFCMTLLNHSSPSSFYCQYRLMDEPVEFLDEEKMKSVKKKKK